MAADYDGAPTVFLPLILASALAICPQQPGRWCTVSAAAADVSPAVVARVQADADGAVARLQEVFGGPPKQPFHVVVHRRRDTLPAAVAAAMPDPTSGVTLLGRHEIHLVLDAVRASDGGLQSVVVHEVAHELLDQYAAPQGEHLPRWLHEGLAQTLAGTAWLGGREEDLIWRIAAQQLPSLTDLEQDFRGDPIDLQAAYNFSFSFVAWLVREYGIDTVLRAVRKVDESTSFMAALVRITRRTSQQLYDGWEQYLRHGSGAGVRALLDSCFYLSMILALPLAALAMMRRFGAERRARERLERQEQLEQEQRERQRLEAAMRSDDGSGDPE